MKHPLLGQLQTTSIQLMHTDSDYAYHLKRRLEELRFARYMQASSWGILRVEINPKDLAACLAGHYIFVEAEDIHIDFKNGLCRIQLHPEVRANVPCRNAAAYKSFILPAETKKLCTTFGT